MIARFESVERTIQKFSRRLDDHLRRDSSSAESMPTNHSRARSASPRANPFDDQSVTTNLGGDEGLEDEGKAPYEMPLSEMGEPSARHSEWSSVSSDTERDEDSDSDDGTTPIDDSQSDISDESYMESIIAATNDEGEGDSGPELFDEIEDDTASLVSNTATSDIEAVYSVDILVAKFPSTEKQEGVNSDTATTSGFDNETNTNPTATDSDNPEAASAAHASNKQGPGPVPEFGPNVHDAQPSASTPPQSDTQTDQPTPPVCAHSNVRIHTWGWSLVIYASAGMRVDCRECGRQWCTAEFSSLLQTSENGGAELNWQHISHLRWWPGGSWSWQ